VGARRTSRPPTARGEAHLIQPLPNYFGLLFVVVLPFDFNQPRTFEAVLYIS